MRARFSKVLRVLEIIKRTVVVAEDIEQSLVLHSHGNNLHMKDVYLFLIRVEFIL